MQVKKYITKQDINFYIEIKPISKQYQRIVYKDKNNNWNYSYKNNFDNYDYLNTKDIKRIRFYNLLSNIEIMGV